MLIISNEYFNKTAESYGIGSDEFNTALISSSATVVDMYNAKFINEGGLLEIAKHFNETGAPLYFTKLAKAQMETNNSTPDKSGQIAIDVEKCVNAFFYDSSYNLSNAINGHEGDHYSHYQANHYTYFEVSEDLRELRAYRAQKSHSSWVKVTDKYRKLIVERYGPLEILSIN